MKIVYFSLQRNACAKNIVFSVFWVVCCHFYFPGVLCEDEVEYAMGFPQNYSERLCVHVLNFANSGIFDNSTGLLKEEVITNPRPLLNKSIDNDKDDSNPKKSKCMSLSKKGFVRFRINQSTASVLGSLVGSGKGKEKRVNDWFLPVPSRCFGRRYVLSSWMSGESFSYFVAINVNNASVRVTGKPASTQSEPKQANKLFTEQLTFEIKPRDYFYKAAQGRSLDGYQLSSDKPFGVLAGASGVKLVNTEFWNNGSLIDMFPPTKFFSNEYIVWYKHSNTFGINGSVAFLKIVSLEESGFPVNLSIVTRAESKDILTNRVLTSYGSTLTEEQRYSVFIRADGPVMVVQFVDDGAGPMQTLIPPTGRWAWSAFVPAVKESHDDIGDDFRVRIIIKTKHTGGFGAFSVVTGKRFTVQFQVLVSLGYSYAIVYNPHEALLLQHASYHPFQVVVYGRYGKSQQGFATSLAMNITCHGFNVTADIAYGKTGADDDASISTWLALSIGAGLLLFSVPVIYGAYKWRSNSRNQEQKQAQEVRKSDQASGMSQYNIRNQEQKN